MSAETKVEETTNADGTSVSQPIANTHVVRSPCRFNIEWANDTRTKAVFVENKNGRYTIEHLSSNIGESIS